MCAWLGVSRSGYYEWRERPASATAQRRTLLAESVAEIFAGSHEAYGYRRVHAALARRGEHCSAELVRALMREQGLVPAQVRAFRPATMGGGGCRCLSPCPNHARWGERELNRWQRRPWGRCWSGRCAWSIIWRRTSSPPGPNGNASPTSPAPASRHPLR
ncbi:IS3 family transposase [Nonomuraea rosea]